jgi:hypothetical protein
VADVETGQVARPSRGVALRIVATTLVTALTIALIGAVAILTTTSLGCGPAPKLGLKGIANRCKTVAGLAPVASPTFSPRSNPTPTSAYPPPASGPHPPSTGLVSSAYPPFSPPVSNGGGLAVPTYPLTCRLPVYAGPPGSGGFIQFPAGTFVADPKSAVIFPSPVATGPATVGNDGMTFDRAFGRWLPVRLSAVTPDGRRYVFVDGDAVYAIDVSTGGETKLGQGQAWIVVGVETQGVYARMLNQPGLWFLPFAGEPQQVTTTGFWEAEGGGAAYGTTTSALPQGVDNTIMRLDLKTGATIDWFTHPGTDSLMRGFDAQGDAIIEVDYSSGGDHEIWIAYGPNRAEPLFGSPSGLAASGTPIADDHGIWFAAETSSPGGYNPSGSGVMLYVPGSGLYWMSSYGVQVAGTCS